MSDQDLPVLPLRQAGTYNVQDGQDEERLYHDFLAVRLLCAGF